MILNELSMCSSLTQAAEANQIISKFLKVCHEIANKNDDHDFYYTEDLFTAEIAPEYTIHRWLLDSRIPQNEKAFLRTMINRKQVIDKSLFWGSELLVEDMGETAVSAVGCLAAYESEEYVVSMCTNLLWEKEYIKGTYITAEKKDEIVHVRNCCSSEQVESLVLEEHKKLFRMVSSGAELWEKREDLYPHLIFCECVKKQLVEVEKSLHLKTIMGRMQILEDYFQTFEGRFNKNKLGYRCREESKTVEKNKELHDMRVFKTPYGGEEFFSWHISFPGDFPGRIHFIPDALHKKGIIGYVGKHLPTGKFSTI